MADVNNTIKTTVVVDATQAQQQIIKLGAIASDSTKTLQERIAAKNKQVKLQEQLSKQTISNLEKEIKALEKVEGKEKELERAVKKLNAERVKATRLSANNEKQLNKLSAAQDKAGKSAKGLSINFKGIGSQLLGATGLVGGVSALVGVFTSSVKIFKDFEQSSSNLAAILGKSKEEIKTLTEQAKDLGSTTAFTASQVVAAQTELAKLGFNPEKIEKSIEGILSLAAATGTDLARSAEIAASTLNIFNLDASESGRVSDVLAKSTTITSLSMEKLSTIMPIVGKTAQLAGVSLERTAALAGTLTDRGIDASSAATSLRNIFIELSAKGLTWDQAMQKINGSTDKTKTAVDLFGKRAGAAAVVLSETGAKVDYFTEQLEGSAGAAEKMANVMLDNLSGDITKAQSSWEGFILSLEDGDGIISKVLRGATQAFTSFLEQLKNLNNGVKELSGVQKEQIGFYEIQEKNVNRVSEALSKITDETKRATEAEKLRITLQIEQLKRNKELNEAIKEGRSIDEINTRLSLEAIEKQIEAVGRYIPQKKEENKLEEESKEITEEQIKAIERKAEAQKKEEERRRKNLQRGIEAVDAREQAEAEAEQKAIDDEIERENRQIAEEERRNKERAERDLIAQIERDELLLEQQNLNNEQKLAAELDLLERRRNQELANSDLTGKERMLILEQYEKAEQDMVKASEKAKTDFKKEAIRQGIMAAGEAFGISQELAVAQMLIAAPQAIGDSFKNAAKFYPPPASIALGALGAAGVVAPIIKGLSDIKKTRFSGSKGKGSGGGGSISSPSGGSANRSVQTEAVTDIAANNTARLGVDPSIGSAAGADAANNVTGGASSGIVFSESKYNEFQDQVDFKEEKTTI